MANFFQDPNPTGDPDYMKSSKEPERVQADTSMGTLFSGIADVTKDAGSALGTIFDTKIKKDAQDIINPIRADAGADLSVADATTIAGTGAKGRVRALQMRNGAGGDGTDPTQGPLGFAPEDASLVQQQTAGIFDGVDKPAQPLPPAASQELSRLNRLKTAYFSGDLSDSHFSAELLAGASKLKARYPGFEDEVDTAFEKITGQNSANSLRKSLIQDIQYNQMAAMSAQSADDKFREKYRGEISALGYDPDHGDLNTIKPAVNDFLGQQASLHATQLRAEVGTPQAEAALSDTINLQVNTGLGALHNKAQGQMGLTDYIAQAKEMTLKGGGSPKDIDALVTQMEFAKQQQILSINKEIYTPIEGRKDGHTPVSLLGPGADGKVQTIMAARMKPWDDAIALVKSGNMSALQQTTDNLKYQSNLDVANLYRAFPQARSAAAISTAFPNNPIMSNRFIEFSNILPDFQKAIGAGIGNAIINGTKDTPAPTPSQALGAYGPANPNDPTATVRAARATVKQYDMVISPENKNTENAAHVATQFFTDQKFYDNLNDSGRLKLFMTMASPEKSAFVQRMAATGHPEVADQYKQWATYAAGDIWRRNSDDMQSLITTKAYDIQFNPQSGMFEDHTKYPSMDAGGGARIPGKAPSNITTTLASVNNAMTILKPIVGNKPEEILNSMGIDPHAPKEDFFVDKITKALGDKLQDWSSSGDREAIRSGRAPAGQTPLTPTADPDHPETTRGVIKGNLSDSQIVGMETESIPEGMSAREFLQRLKDAHAGK